MIMKVGSSIKEEFGEEISRRQVKNTKNVKNIVESPTRQYPEKRHRLE